MHQVRAPLPPESISPLEILSRFATSKHHYRRLDNKISWNAFMPNRERETSVYRTNGMSAHEIWTLGDARGGPQSLDS